MSSDLRERLRAAAAIPSLSVSAEAIEVEVARRRRSRRRLSAVGVVVVAAALGASLPFALSGSPQGTARLNVTPPPQPTATAGPSGKPTLRLSWSGPPRDGAAATVIGAGFSPGASVQIAPCQPDADCVNPPDAAVRADSAGGFRVRVTAHLVIRDAIGDLFMCAQNCSYAASLSSGQFVAKTATFDLVALPPAGEKCSEPTLQLSYVGPGPSATGSRSAAFRVRNTGERPCWVYGGGDVGLDGQPPLPKVGWLIDQSAPAWPPKVLTLQPGGTAHFTVTKPVCTGTSMPLTKILFGDIDHNDDVSLPSGAQAQLALCANVTGPTANLPAPENVLTVSAYTAG